MWTVITISRLFVLATVFGSHATFSDASAVAVTPTASVVKTTESSGNPVGQLFGYLKDSVVRTIDGSKEMYSNHGRCKEIRAKQKVCRDTMKQQWESEGLTPREMKEKLQSINGGISYDEFVFLSKGKEDRGKLMNMLFLMWGAPRLFPYALMFYPDVLPAPFQPLPDASGMESTLEKLSRQRSHIVIETLLSLEKEAREIPALSKLNIFGRKKQQKNMESINDLDMAVGNIMSAPGAYDGSGIQMALDAIDDLLYKKDLLTRQEKRLVGLPSSIILGLMNSVNGPAPFTKFQPNFMKRGNLLTHIQKITASDNFLVSEKVDLGTLSTARLLEACNDRMIGGLGRSTDDMRKGLSDWLKLAVEQPNNRTLESGENFNENLARAALLSYYSVEGARDFRNPSYLPRLMFQGQMKKGVGGEEISSKKRWNR
jgi:hypothetical protein